jgi:hypothetical protein
MPLGAPLLPHRVDYGVLELGEAHVREGPHVVPRHAAYHQFLPEDSQLYRTATHD